MRAARRALWLLGWPVRTLAIGLLAGYRRFLSPALGVRCRFHPTCSAYALDAVRIHGAVKGLGLSVWRVLRCSPFTEGGIDRVPPRRRRAEEPLVSDNIIQERSAA